jgi:uncharacterized cupin superfamily protein
MSEKPPIINLNELELNDFGHGEKFSARLGRIGAPLGMQKMGCGLVVLEPGKRAWPYHGHHVAEEAFIVLEGEGTLRYADAEYPITTGDVIFTPPGPDRAHQIINTSEATLKYLALSSNDSPEICYYPDSNKINAFHATKTGFTNARSWADQHIDYWDGED